MIPGAAGAISHPCRKTKSMRLLQITKISPTIFFLIQVSFRAKPKPLKKINVMKAIKAIKPMGLTVSRFRRKTKIRIKTKET